MNALTPLDGLWVRSLIEQAMGVDWNGSVTAASDGLTRRSRNSRQMSKLKAKIMRVASGGNAGSY